MAYRREYTPATYGRDFTHNLRWRYRTRYGEGSDPDPYRVGGSYGRGYRASGFGVPRPGRPGYGRELRRGERRGRRREWRYHRPGTAARDYDRAYPNFSSAAAVEAAQGYPPGDPLNPATYPRDPWYALGSYAEEF